MLSESIKRGRRKLILELVKLNLEIIFFYLVLCQTELLNVI